MMPLKPDVITLGFEKIGCDSSRNFIGGGGLSSRDFKDSVPLSFAIFISSSVLGVMVCGVSPSTDDPVLPTPLLKTLPAAPLLASLLSRRTRLLALKASGSSPAART